MLEQLFADRRIEDLPLDFFCVSTNLTRSTCTVHRNGLLSDALSASCAVPGLRPPRSDGRDILVAGGVLNNLPVDVMRAAGRGPVFASSASPRADLCLDREYPDFVSPWRVLLSWLNPWGTPILVPTLANILVRTYTIQDMTSAEPADLMVEPSGDCINHVDHQAIDAIADAGYRDAMQAIERWQTPRPA
jgi:predicted acylesterase/phospholipase RssA